MSDRYDEHDEELSRLEDEHLEGLAESEDQGEASAEGDDEGREGAPRGADHAVPDRLWRIKAKHSNETWYAWSEGEQDFAEGLAVVAPTRYGKDICIVQGPIKTPGRLGSDELVKIERIATAEDLAKAKANEEKEAKAFETCRQKIETRGLPMKLVSAHYLLEESRILFFFSAESRVDFRELVKDLVSVFKTRIELRQIGVRDEARVIGGCGVCGRVLCCHGVSDKLTPVSIKMAKDQNLSLNSMKISGPCGRLLCCLAYEYGFYRDARRELPGEGVRFPHDGTLFRVIEVNALAGTVKVAGEDGRFLEMPASRFVHSEGKWRVREEEQA
ncbi:MAG TPA: regulatory iron-sulfur-containing complex subunit RicT [Rectinemataceae bacterium]|nr:regulatory iron-sulfur-containing complex subunit RicT [Rectinemataceae bacterium]